MYLLEKGFTLSSEKIMAGGKGGESVQLSLLYSFQV